jgi:hypothetical protein
VFCTALNIATLDWNTVWAANNWKSKMPRRIKSYTWPQNSSKVASGAEKNVVFPSLLAQIDHTLEDMVINETSEMYMSYTGGIMPNHKKFHVNYNVS